MVMPNESTSGDYVVLDDIMHAILMRSNTSSDSHRPFQYEEYKVFDTPFTTLSNKCEEREGENEIINSHEDEQAIMSAISSIATLQKVCILLN